MAQRVRFAAIPNTQPIGYAQAIQLVLGEVRRTRPGMKELREFMRLRNLFDKEGLPALLEILDVSGDPVAPGSVADRLLDADDEPAMREVLSARLVEMNPLLAKYCLEALDTEKGGRLHSTNELYRMVTSYVYPGEKPTLPSFKAWVDWAAAAGLIKVVGIRWALGERGLQSLPGLRAIDAEEFLESERESAVDAASATAEPAIADDPGPSVPVPVPVPVPDSPPPARMAAAPRRPPAPSPADRLSPRRVPVDAGSLVADRDAILAWHAAYPGRRSLALASLGIDPGRKAPGTLLECAFAALLLARGLAPESARACLDSLKTAGLLAAAARGKLPLDAIGPLVARAGDADLVTACECCVHLQRLASGTSDPAALFRADDPRELAWGLWRRLYEPVAPLAPFHLARLALETGLLPERLAAAAFVPTFAVRVNAFRIGFADALHAASFAELLDAGVALSRWFGAPGFEAPLSQVHEGYGCSFRCGRVATCPLACREKSEIA
jgi:hypothetical protein